MSTTDPQDGGFVPPRATQTPLRGIPASPPDTPNGQTGVCGLCGHFWDWHGQRDNGACKGGYLIGMKVASCDCRQTYPPSGAATELDYYGSDT